MRSYFLFAALLGFVVVDATLIGDGPAVGKGLQTQNLECDVFVAGGGSSGISAAIAAARNGAKTILVHGRPMLGGNAASEDRLHMVGATQNGGRGSKLKTEAREGGIVEEYTLEDCVQNPQRAAVWFDLTCYNLFRAEPNVHLILNTMFVAVNMEGDKITEAIAESQISQIRYVIKAKVFIDTTGDGRLGAEAGAEFIEGREGRAVYNESHAPLHGDNQTEGSSLAFTAKDMGTPQKFVRPPWAKKLTKENFKYRDLARLDYGFWWNEVSSPYNTIRDNEKIRDVLLEYMMGIWDYLKNDPEQQKRHNATNWALDWFEWWPCKREGRRFIGQYVMRQSDVVNEDNTPNFFPDRVAYGGWSLDLHSPWGILKPSVPPNHAYPVPLIYSTPLRSLVSKDVSNLMWAGRLASYSHVVFGSQRVMKTTSTCGQAAGTAAAYATANNVAAQDLYKAPHIWSIQQQLIRDDAYVIGIYNEDPRDYARNAKTIVASSEWEEGKAINVISGQTRAVDGPKGAAKGQYKAGTNRWMSKGVPAYITLEWEKPIPIAEIQLIFDTGMHRKLTLSQSVEDLHGQIWGSPQPETVKDYHLSVANGTTKWTEVVSVTDNYQRKRVHQLKPVKYATTVRLDCTATNGLENAHIMEIRVYDEDGMMPFPKKA